ncbi:hypothetical protein NPIL_178891 [Nephila pilipes]|uniref:Uncharacterized protein n=1 Tax=Nephila pilipes TaxID=299642 RepID=A0A8X6TGV0_NEPPI|nr:hypothetical protein NPIL_178891 [Nephila pilipes]
MDHRQDKCYKEDIFQWNDIPTKENHPSSNSAEKEKSADLVSTTNVSILEMSPPDVIKVKQGAPATYEEEATTETIDNPHTGRKSLLRKEMERATYATIKEPCG